MAVLMASACQTVGEAEPELSPGPPEAGTAAGGSGGTSAVPADTTSPTFAGAVSVEVIDETTVRVHWEVATDDVSESERLSYRVYTANAAGAEDFTEISARAPAGATSAYIDTLTPGLGYFFVVRAVDGAGNEDGNTVEVSASTPDQSSPFFGGVRNVDALTSRSLLIEWGAAYDGAVAPRDLVYRVYVATEASGQDFSTPTYISEAGETSVILEGRDPNTVYHVIVRAVDPSGNEDANIRQMADATPEGIPPEFEGLVLAEKDGTSVHLYWPPATDNQGDSLNIVYDIYESLTRNGQDYSSPSYTSSPGTHRHTVTGLAAGTRYFYVVRARDPSGNSDSNIVEHSAKTDGVPDIISPVFGGISTMVALSPATVEFRWVAAVDATDSALQISYEVYVSDSPNPPLTEATIVTRPGETSVTYSGLAPGQLVYAVVRARDRAGNLDNNNLERSQSTLTAPTNDVTLPLWSSSDVSAEMDVGLSFRLAATWSPAFEEVSAGSVDGGADGGDASAPGVGSGEGTMLYHLCVAEQGSQSECVGNEFYRHIHSTTTAGTLAINLDGLAPRTDHYVYIRPEDAAGNILTDANFVIARTATSWTANVKPLLESRCVACHSGGIHPDVDLDAGVDGGAAERPDFGNINSLVRVSSYADESVGTERLPFIDQNGRPEMSLIYRRINPLGFEGAPFSAGLPNTYVGPQEPRNDSAFTGDEDDILRSWIEQGANGN